MSQTQIELLLLDSDPESSSRLSDIAQRAHYLVHNAADVSQAMEMYVERQPQIVITDAYANGGSAADLIRLVCADENVQAIAVMSNSDSQQVVIDCLKAGAREYLKKPVTEHDFKSVLSRFLGEIKRRQDKILRPQMVDRLALEFEIETKSDALAPAVNSVLSLISGLTTKRILKRMELALNEMLRNAYEHGNLGLTYSQKMNLCGEGKLEKVLRELSEQAVRDGKRISVAAGFADATFQCTVADQGGGFDWAEVQQFMLESDSLHKLNGRGLVLISSVFDSVSFNESGSEITVKKFLT